MEGRPQRAQCWLWKDHTSWRESGQNHRALAQSFDPSTLRSAAGSTPRNGFGPSSGHCLNVAPETFGAAFSWVELADWVPSVLAGVADPRLVKRGRVRRWSQGALLQRLGRPSRQGVPGGAGPAPGRTSRPALRKRRMTRASGAGIALFDLVGEAGACHRYSDNRHRRVFDVHYGAIGCGVREGTLVKVIGTSTCDCAWSFQPRSRSPIFPGICGIVKRKPFCPASSASMAGQFGGRRHIWRGGSRLFWAATLRFTLS